MKKLRIQPNITKISQKGSSLIEVLIAIAVLSLIVVAFVAGIGTAYKTNAVGDEQTTAESLSRAQLEYIQSQPYSSSLTYDYLSVPEDMTGYSYVTPMVNRLDPKHDGAGNDDGVQQILVSVSHNGKTVFTLEDYKAKR